jgi:FkbM family methyltransferase
LNQVIFILRWTQGRGSGPYIETSGELKLISRIIKKLDNNSNFIITYDVGANYGKWSKYWFRKLKDNNFNYQGVIFEPQRECLIHLEKLAQNHSATVIPACVGEESGETILYTDNEGSSRASTVSKSTEAMIDSMTNELILPMVRLSDNLFSVESVSNQVNICKIDVEGLEIHILKDIFHNASEHFDIIQFEYGFQWINDRSYLHDVFDMLPKNYKIRRLYPDGKLSNPIIYTSELEDFQCTNYVVVHDRIEGVICR